VPEKGLSKRERIDSFEQLCLPHLKSAFNLARWLTRNEHDAEDVLQEAYLRGFIFFEGFNGSNARTWILKVVRNSCYTWLQKNRPVEVGTAFDEELHSDRAQEAPVFGRREPSPEESMLSKDTGRRINQALEALPLEFREVFILREFEGLTYKEIAEVSQIALGTVMSRLSRARDQLQRELARHPRDGDQP
jgi:RNA polymerase sigma-70 factor (ECF subfamily)